MCLSDLSFGHFAGFTVTASTNVWFVANWGKWADGIHQDVVPVLRRCPGCRVYFSFVIGRVARLIRCWLMAQHSPTCFSPTHGWNLCVSALLEDIIVHNRWHLWWMIVFLCWFPARNWNAIFNLFHENGLFFVLNIIKMFFKSSFILALWRAGDDSRVSPYVRTMTAGSGCCRSIWPWSFSCFCIDFLFFVHLMMKYIFQTQCIALFAPQCLFLYHFQTYICEFALFLHLQFFSPTEAYLKVWKFG